MCWSAVTRENMCERGKKKDLHRDTFVHIAGEIVMEPIALRAREIYLG
jgi:hypothetical protein